MVVIRNFWWLVQLCTICGPILAPCGIVFGGSCAGRNDGFPSDCDLIRWHSEFHPLNEESDRLPPFRIWGNGAAHRFYLD
jgi:hypothetical protein